LPAKGKMKPVPTNDRKPPPDLWMELKNMDKGGQDGAVTTTGRNSQDMKTGDDGSGKMVTDRMMSSRLMSGKAMTDGFL